MHQIGWAVVEIVILWLAILATAVAVLGQLYNVEKRIRFVEPDAVLVIAIILGSLALIYYMG